MKLGFLCAELTGRVGLAGNLAEHFIVAIRESAEGMLAEDEVAIDLDIEDAPLPRDQFRLYVMS